MQFPESSAQPLQTRSELRYKLLRATKPVPQNWLSKSYGAWSMCFPLAIVQRGSPQARHIGAAPTASLVHTTVSVWMHLCYERWYLIHRNKYGLWYLIIRNKYGWWSRIYLNKYRYIHLLLQTSDSFTSALSNQHTHTAERVFHH